MESRWMAPFVSLTQVRLKLLPSDLYKLDDPVHGFLIHKKDNFSIIKSKKSWSFGWLPVCKAIGDGSKNWNIKLFYFCFAIWIFFSLTSQMPEIQNYIHRNWFWTTLRCQRILLPLLSSILETITCWTAENGEFKKSRQPKLTL